MDVSSSSVLGCTAERNPAQATRSLAVYAHVGAVSGALAGNRRCQAVGGRIHALSRQLLNQARHYRELQEPPVVFSAQHHSISTTENPDFRPSTGMVFEV
jgi:hypothetical protein